MTGAVFFDFNGVLVDDEAQHCHALQTVLRDEGIILSREEYYAHYLGVDDRAGFVQAYRRANRTLTSAQVQRLVEAKSQLYQQLIRTSLEIVAGAAEFVRAAAERFRLAIVSGALRREVELALTRTGFADRSRRSLRRTTSRSASPIPPAISRRVRRWSSANRSPRASRSRIRCPDSRPRAPPGWRA